MHTTMADEDDTLDFGRLGLSSNSNKGSSSTSTGASRQGESLLRKGGGNNNKTMMTGDASDASLLLDSGAPAYLAEQSLNDFDDDDGQGQRGARAGAGAGDDSFELAMRGLRGGAPNSGPEPGGKDDNDEDADDTVLVERGAQPRQEQRQQAAFMGSMGALAAAAGSSSRGGTSAATTAQQVDATEAAARHLPPVRLTGRAAGPNATTRENGDGDDDDDDGSTGAIGEAEGGASEATGAGGGATTTDQAERIRQLRAERDALSAWNDYLEEIVDGLEDAGGRMMVRSPPFVFQCCISSAGADALADSRSSARTGRRAHARDDAGLARLVHQDCVAGRAHAEPLARQRLARHGARTLSHCCCCCCGKTLRERGIGCTGSRDAARERSGAGARGARSPRRGRTRGDGGGGAARARGAASSSSSAATRFGARRDDEHDDWRTARRTRRGDRLDQRWDVDQARRRWDGAREWRDDGARRSPEWDWQRRAGGQGQCVCHGRARRQRPALSRHRLKSWPCVNCNVALSPFQR